MDNFEVGDIVDFILLARDKIGTYKITKVIPYSDPNGCAKCDYRATRIDLEIEVENCYIDDSSRNKLFKVEAVAQTVVASIVSNKAPINDHTCPNKWCGNNRCSKSEKVCWKCGGNL